MAPMMPIASPARYSCLACGVAMLVIRQLYGKARKTAVGEDCACKFLCTAIGARQNRLSMPGAARVGDDYLRFNSDPSKPLTMPRPTDEPIERAADLTTASTTVSLRREPLLPNRSPSASCMRPP